MRIRWQKRTPFADRHSLRSHIQADIAPLPIIIEVNHLTKEYRLGAMQGLKQELLPTAARLTGKKAEERSLFKALDDINRLHIHKTSR